MTSSNNENHYGGYASGQYGQTPNQPQNGSFGQGVEKETTPSYESVAQAGSANGYGAGEAAPSQASTSPAYNSTNYGSPDGSQQSPGQSYSQQGYNQQGYSAPSYGQPNHYGGQPATYQQYDAPYIGRTEGPKGMAIASLVLGILAFMTGWTVVGGALGLVGLVLGIVALRNVKHGGGGKGLAIAGIILSVLGLISAIILGVLFGWIFAAGFECSNEPTQAAIDRCMNERLGIE
ncbi:DUF4190 domain-containing protein [Rothia nasisuis]|uniref:DUF4190 domain-containing protein n=1 Tax=Rothia nasisuis TaxID=2109647 RepID=UPI001F15C359|nr:DUF4190 domain-containing protein [Rothia nasisuis]